MRVLGRSFVVAALLGAACSAGPSTATPTPAPTATTVIPDTTPPAGFVAFKSNAAPYRACYPHGWQVRADWTDLGVIRGDAFVGGTPGELPDAASILAEPTEGENSSQYLELVLTNLRAAGFGTEVLGRAQVNGVDAELLRFARLTSGGQRYTVQEAVWAQAGYGWVLTISSSPANADRAMATIRAMLGCFRMP